MANSLQDLEPQQQSAPEQNAAAPQVTSLPRTNASSREWPRGFNPVSEFQIAAPGCLTLASTSRTMTTASHDPNFSPYGVLIPSSHRLGLRDGSNELWHRPAQQYGMNFERAVWQTLYSWRSRNQIKWTE